MEDGESESSSPARPVPYAADVVEVGNEIYAALHRSQNEEALAIADLLDQLYAHLSRLPKRYRVELNMDCVEDVLLHRKILAEAQDPEKRPVIHVRFLKYVETRASEIGHQQQPEMSHFGSRHSSDNGQGRDIAPNQPSAEGSTTRNRVLGVDFEPCSKLEDLNLAVKGHDKEIEEARWQVDAFSERQDSEDTPIHEIIFSSIDKPKLLSQFSAWLSDIGLNIREAHVFSTIDGYLLDVFEVEGWPDEETDGLMEELQEAVGRCEGSLSGSSHSSATGKFLLQPKFDDWEIDRRLLKIREKIGDGSCGELYRGTYLGQDVAVKFVRGVQSDDVAATEFNQEVSILREVNHENVVRLIGACSKPPEFCIVTEYMQGGSLYEYLHKHETTIKLPQLLKFALDVSKGMDYLHQKNIIHRDLKTANLLMDSNKVVKVADFGVARIQCTEGVMTAETGTYRWMAPEIINHEAYNHKADVFSFAIVLWELATSRVPYDDMTPVQAALGVRQGLRPELPQNIHPRLADLMKRCWETDPSGRPSFHDIASELEEFLQQIQATEENMVKAEK